MPVRVAILGSTGSIGRSALSVVETHPDRVQVVALAAGNNVERLAEQVARFRPSLVSVATDEGLQELKRRVPAVEHPAEMCAGASGLLAAATHPDVDLVLCASSGAAGLEAALAAIDHRKTVALANKEVLVMAGALMVDAARRHGVSLLPVDSEHNAIHQCLHGRSAAEVRRLVLTASGGPFRLWDRAALQQVTPADALRHPTWQMGRKITIDSATLMNKGLEVIEARWLFDVQAPQIDVVVHPQSVVHSMVELTDGSVIAQLGVTDMRLPIQYAFAYPDRWPAPVPHLDLASMGPLEFCAPDRQRFPCLRLAYEALEHGGAWPVVLNAANEVAVQAFLDGQLRFVDIAVVIERALEAAGRETSVPRDLVDVRRTDHWAREAAAETVRTLPSMP
jgi:1-deoxy-D-xylulose-5-phosphate reductoisomerase